MSVASRNVGEGARGWGGLTGGVIPPTLNGSLDAESAGVPTPSGHGCEGARGWGGLTGGVIPPTLNGSVGVERTGVPTPSRNSGKGACRRVGLGRIGCRPNTRRDARG